MGMSGEGRSIRRISVVPGVGLTSGRVLVGTGFFYSPRGDAVAFLGLLLPSRYSARVAAVVLGKRSSPPGLADRLTGLSVLRPSGS